MPLIDSLSGHLASSKSRAFQERTRERFARFVGFLQDNNLAVTTILESGAYPDRDLVIRYEDLTDEGAAVVRAAYHKWLQGIDKGKSPSDLGTLEAALAKVRRQ